MLKLVAEEKATKLLGRYFTQLDGVGYVKHDQIKRLMAYLFFVEFLQNTYDFFTEEDYKKLANALSILFVGASCLLPYQVFCTNRAKLGSAHYMGSLKIRATEVDANDRATEDNYWRGV